MSRTAIHGALALALGAGSGWAAESVQQTRPAEARGRVQIENPSGRVTVTGWDRNEVAVGGHIDSGAAELDFTSGGGVTRISVETEGNPHSVHSQLDVRVPKGSVVDLEGFNTSFTVSGVSGGVHAESVNGSIGVTGPVAEVDLETVNGQVSVTGPARVVRAASVNGQVTVQNAGEDVDASTVNGSLLVSAGTVRRARLETVSGQLRFEGGLAPEGRLEAQTVSGRVELAFRGPVDARFDVSTFSGGIENQLGPAARRTDEHTPGRELTFSVGSGSGTVTVETLSGQVRILHR